MKSKRLLVVLASVCVILVLALGLPGCAGEEEAPAAPAAPVAPGEEEEPAPAAPVVPAPVAPGEEEEPAVPTPAAEEVYHWQFQGMSYPGTTGWESQLEFQKLLEETTGGRIQLTMNGAGVICGVFEMFEATGGGVLDICHTSSSYTFGMVPCQEYGWGIGGMLPTYADTMYLFWYMQPRSWNDILNDALVEHNLYAPRMCGFVLYGAFASTVPIRRLADVDGLMIRSFGDIGKIWEAAGAQLVTISAGEMYTALALGTIDAANWGSADGFKQMHIEEVCSYYIDENIMGYGEEGRYLNLDVWNSLPADLQQCYIRADQCYNDYSIQHAIMTDIAAKRYFAEEWGTEIIHWPQEDKDACMALALELTMEREPKDQWCAERVQTLTDFMKFRGYID